MNLTAVQLQKHAPARRLVYGRPADVRPSARNRGDVALFHPASLVAYELCVARRRRVFVFRTLLAEDRLAASVPGVHRRVQLLFTLRGRARIERLRRALARLEAIGWPPAALPDAFFLRLGASLEGRLPRHPVLASLLPRPQRFRVLSHSDCAGKVARAQPGVPARPPSPSSLPRRVWRSRTRASSSPRTNGSGAARNQPRWSPLLPMRST